VLPLGDMPPAAKSRRDERIALAVRDLVAAHRKLDDVRITAALWLKSAEPGVWVLEVAPDMASDPKADEPMEFAPAKGFRFTLNLLLARENDFRAAIRRNPDFARRVAEAEPISPSTQQARDLQRFARGHAPTAPAARKPRSSMRSRRSAA
jgi:hypothetical protein